MRETSRLIKREYNESNIPLCLIPPCNNISEKYKTVDKFKNYCEIHSYEDIKKYTNWVFLRKYILERDGKKCIKCNDDRELREVEVDCLGWDGEKNVVKKKVLKIMSNLEVDHIIEVSDGGDMWSEENLQTLCYSCHKKKTIFFNKGLMTKNQRLLKECEE